MLLRCGASSGGSLSSGKIAPCAAHLLRLHQDHLVAAHCAAGTRPRNIQSVGDSSIRVRWNLNCKPGWSALPSKDRCEVMLSLGPAYCRLPDMTLGQDWGKQDEPRKTRQVWNARCKRPTLQQASEGEPNTCRDADTPNGQSARPEILAFRWSCASKAAQAVCRGEVVWHDQARRRRGPHRGMPTVYLRYCKSGSLPACPTSLNSLPFCAGIPAGFGVDVGIVPVFAIAP